MFTSQNQAYFARRKAVYKHVDNLCDWQLSTGQHMRINMNKRSDN